MAKILVADDNSNIQKMVGLALKDQGIDVVAVGNGEAAVRKISDVKPDLVLADVFMPVRNGYEVCRYVKEDSALAHIPVILLVGAFDPLDEQEAQRVGADGVLKKPFVPPDPLISMVKSALVRAGIPLGGSAPVEKTPPPPQRSTADILSGASPKLAALAPETLPEIPVEPVEEFPAAAPQFKIAAGNEPLAFGSLLDTQEADDLAVTSKPMINLAQNHKWTEEPNDVQEEPEEEEESVKGSWRPGGLEEIERAAETTHAAPDWRDQAFHGNSPASSFSSNHWPSSLEQPGFAEAAESHSIAVATVEAKPAGSPLPFSGDAWAAAMASGVEEKLAKTQEVAPEATAVTEASPTPEIHQHSAEQVSIPAPEQSSVSTIEHPSAAEPAPSAQNAEPANWAPVPETAWELEAKKASLLASTWDAPKTFSPEETQEVPVYTSEPAVEHSKAPAEVAAESSNYSSEPIAANESTAHSEAMPSESAAVEPATQAAPEPSFEAAEPKSWENTWEAPAAPVTEPVHAEAPVAESTPAATAQPDMDELVARVLGKMNPEVLQKVTREILKPVIEAIIRDEIDSKKS